MHKSSRQHYEDVFLLAVSETQFAWRFAGVSMVALYKVPTVREKSGKNEKNSRSGKSQGILSSVMEI